MYLYLDWMNRVEKTRNKVIGGVVTATIILIVAFSRLYQGMHTLDQVLYGVVIGTWLASSFHFCF